MFIIKSFINYIYKDIIEYLRYSIAIYLEKLYIYNIRCYKYITFKEFICLNQSLDLKQILFQSYLWYPIFYRFIIKKVYFKGGNIWITFIILFDFGACDFMYNKKYNDLVDEASKLMLLKVDHIASKIMLYSIFLIAVFF